MKAKNNSEDDILLKTLFNYIAPFLNNKYTGADLKDGKQEDSLEGKLKNKTVGLGDILFLEQLILNNLKNSNKNSKIKIKKEINPKELDFFGIFLNENNIGNKTVNDEISYSLSIINKKERSEERGYSISIRYEENSSEEKLDVSIKFDNYGLDKLDPLNKLNKNKIKNQQNNLYSFSIINKKDNKNSGNYSVKINYDDNYAEERLAISYKSTIGAYLNKRQESLHDFTDRVPGKFVNVFPESVMGGVLGFTYLGENFMGLRSDLTGNLKKMVDIHESIHTPDEYETRILTDWIMSKERVRYIK